MTQISIIAINVNRNKLSVEFDVSEDLLNYFSNEKTFEVEYSEDISNVPDGILIIPFVCNVLPIVWLTDATLLLPVLDKTFYDSIPDIKNGYVNMSPMLTFKGDVIVEKLQKNEYTATHQTAAFFSGGVDAFATLIAHADEKPTLITLYGADIKLTDTVGWNNVREHVEKTIADFELPPPVMVKSNFRQFVRESNLENLVITSGDGWWHGYQHGIGLIGHAAPIAYIKRLKTVYIASTYTKEDKVICASDPTIDNMVKMGSCRVWHDQYEYSRQEKLTNIINWVRKKKTYPTLRVCWISSGGKNCCICEKCLRTKYGLLAEGECPAMYGFKQLDTNFSEKKYMSSYILTALPHIRVEWRKIRNRFNETNAYRDDNRISWIYKFDTEAKHNMYSKFIILSKRVIRKIFNIIAR